MSHTGNYKSDLHKSKATKKPVMWYYHKAMCEIGWKLRNRFGWHMYYYHLNIMCKKYRINLYGEFI